jgi:hypothetical protein
MIFTFIDKVKNAWSYTSTVSYTLIMWRLIKHVVTECVQFGADDMSSVL